MADTFSTLDTGEYVPLPKVPKAGELTMQDVLGVREPFTPKKLVLQEKLSVADSDVEKAKQEKELVSVRGEVETTKKQSEDIRGAQNTYQAQLEAEPLPAFVPDKESAKDIAGLFSMVSVIGMLLGGGGKLNSMQALNAMNGMLEGHQKGRSDLYKKQATEFDKNFKAMIRKHEEFRKKMEDAVKLAAVDKEAGLADAKMAAVEAGSPIIKAMVERGEIVRALQTLNDTVQGREAALKLVLTEQDRAAVRKATAERDAAAERRYLAQMAQARELAKNRGVGSGGKSSSGKGGAVQFRYNQAMTNAGNQLANEIENAASLPISATPPVLAEVLTDPSKGLTEAGKRFFAQKITDEEARAFQQVFAGMTRAITTIEASGRPSGATEGAIREFAKSQPRAGDKKINVYLSLAQSKQVMDILVKDLKAAEANSVQIAQAEEAKDRVNNIITWTVRDVNRIISSGKSTLIDPKVQDAMGTSQNLSNFNKQIKPSVSKQYATEADAEKAFQAGTLKSGEKVNIGGVVGTWE